MGSASGNSDARKKTTLQSEPSAKFHLNITWPRRIGNTYHPQVSRNIRGQANGVSDETPKQGIPKTSWEKVVDQRSDPHNLGRQEPRQKKRDLENREIWS